MFKSLLIKKYSLLHMFSKLIVPQNFQNIKSSFHKSPQISGLKQYFSYQNASPLFSIITSANHLQRTQRIALLNELQNMCQTENSEKANSDQGLNLLANIHFHKSMELSKMSNFTLTVKELQAAISVIQIMNYPDYFFIGEMERSRGQAFLRMNQLPKAQNAFLKAENYLKQMLDQLLEQQMGQNLSTQTKNTIKVQIGKTRMALAHTLTQLANTFIKESKIYESKSELQKSLQTWQNVNNYRGIPFYQLSVRLKCHLHIIFNQRPQAMQASNELLVYLDDSNSPKLYRSAFEINLAKIWHMNFILANYQQQGTYQPLKSMKQKWEKRFIELVKQSKKLFTVIQFQNIMRSTGLNPQKLAKYGIS